MKNRSRQREAILSVLRSTNTHPTANWIYSEVKRQIPNISLGTVYRNLSTLADAGMILTVDVGDGFVHYDGNTSAHIHLHCRCCDSITDISFNDSFISALAEEKGFTPETGVYVVYGVCTKCKNQDFGGN